MTIFVRDSNQVLLVPESGTYGAVSGAASAMSGVWIGMVTTHTPVEQENLKIVRYTGTSTRNFGQLVIGPQDYSAALVYYPQNWMMYVYALGSNVDVSGTTFSHTISELNSNNGWFATSGTNTATNFPSFTITDSKKGPTDGKHVVRNFTGAVVDKLKLVCKQNEPLVCTVDYKAQGFVLGSSTASIYPILNSDSTRPYVWSDVNFFIPSGTSNALQEITEIDFTIENNTQTRHYVAGSRQLQAIVPTKRDYVVDVTMDANTNWGVTLENYHKNGSVFNALLQVSQSSTKYASIIMSGCKIYTFEAPSDSEGIDSFKFQIRPQTVTITGSDTFGKYNPY